MRILIKDGNIVTATDNYIADILVADGRIQVIGNDLHKAYQADQTIDAGGMYIFPGGIDAHTHMELPFMGTHSSDDFETGTAAGVAGGTTTIIDFAIQTQGKSLKDAFDTWMEKAKGKAVADYAFHMAVTDFNENTKKEIPEMIANGITSFKTFMAYKGALMLDDKMLFGLMKSVKENGGIVTAHTENGDVIESLVKEALAAGHTEPKYHALTRPPFVEAEAASRAMDLAHYTDVPFYIVHTTAKDTLDRVKMNLMRDQKVYIETCIQYLLLDDSVYDEPNFGGAKYVMSPPIRPKGHQEALWKGINLGLVHTVATDHCPFHFHGQKDMGKDNFSKIPNGAPGIENRLSLLYHHGVVEEKISLNRFVEVMSTAPAKIFGLFPRKGTIAVGSDADIVIFDPNQKQTISAKTHKHRADYSMFEGWELKGSVKTVLVNGKIAFHEGDLKVEKGEGNYLHRKPFSHL